MIPIEDLPLFAEHPDGRRPPELAGESFRMRWIRKTVGDLAKRSAAVLIHGEKGTGKELIARTIHLHGPRAGKSFIKVPRSGTPARFVDEELFGGEGEGFAGDRDRRRGRLELADGGTLFLEEVGDISPAAQARLLRVLEFGKFERAGGKETVEVDTRIIAATTNDLELEVRKGNFHPDLHYGLSAAVIRVPSLREREDDIPGLIELLFFQSPERRGRPLSFSAEALDVLTRYHWPGNLRELGNCLREMDNGCRGPEILLQDIPANIVRSCRGRQNREPGHKKQPVPLGLILTQHITSWIKMIEKTDNWKRRSDVFERLIREVEKIMISAALEKTGHVQIEAAKFLGINRNTLCKKIRQYGLDGAIRKAGEAPRVSSRRARR
jgi:DNA-binding NtrC family response regulator